MLKEWKEGSHDLIPDILEIECKNSKDFELVCKEVNNRANGKHEDLDWYKNCYYFLVFNENNKLIGVAAIRDNLTELGKNIWGNIAYGVTPSERRKGYATQIAMLLLKECKKLEMNEVIMCHYIENEISPKIFEKIGAHFDKMVKSEYSGRIIKRYVVKI
jgi:predicted acetyltransferase